MRGRIVEALIIAGFALLLGCALFTAWILAGIWRYGDLIVYEPSRPILVLEIGMAVGAICFAVLCVVLALYAEVSDLWF